jgi:hypothetical protein
MKQLISSIVVVFLIFSLLACEKNKEYMGEGVITGFDVRDCACCGGLLINLNSSSIELYSDSTYQIDDVPQDFDIDNESDFPIFIKLDYSRNGKKCGKTIDILRFEKK